MSDFYQVAPLKILCIPKLSGLTGHKDIDQLIMNLSKWRLIVVSCDITFKSTFHNTYFTLLHVIDYLICYQKLHIILEYTNVINSIFEWAATLEAIQKYWSDPIIHSVTKYLAITGNIDLFNKIMLYPDIATQTNEIGTVYEAVLYYAIVFENFTFVEYLILKRPIVVTELIRCYNTTFKYSISNSDFINSSYDISEQIYTIIKNRDIITQHSNYTKLIYLAVGTLNENLLERIVLSGHKNCVVEAVLNGEHMPTFIPKILYKTKLSDKQIIELMRIDTHFLSKYQLCHEVD